MGNWFYIDGKATKQGPVDEATLLALNREGVVRAATLVWKEGVGEWGAFRQVAAEVFTSQNVEEGGEDGQDEDAAPLAIGVCAHSERVYPLEEMLPYGEALIGPDEKADFVQCLMEGSAEQVVDATLDRVVYAGFWWRCLSSLLDYMIKMLPTGLCMVPYYIARAVSGFQGKPTTESIEDLMGMNGVTLIAYGLGLLGGLLISVAYETWMVGRYQATLGKMIIGLKVVNPDGSPLSYKRAFARWFVKKPVNTLLLYGPPTIGVVIVIAGISALFGDGSGDGSVVILAVIAGLFFCGVLLALCSGIYWMAAFDSEKRTLHDRIVATRVVQK